MRKVLVTGGSGFIGRHTVNALHTRGYEPVRFDRRGTGRTADGAIFLGDIRDAEAVTDAMAHVDGWIHLAGVLGTQETIVNPLPSAQANVLGGINILQAAAQYDLPGVYIAVGNHWMQNTYSITKTTTERFCVMFNTERGTRVNVVRVVNAYGPGQEAATPYGPSKVRKVTPAFVCRALCGTDIEVYGDGEQVSDMVYVKDVANALVNALESAAKGDVFPSLAEIGPVKHVSMNEYAAAIAAEARRYTGKLVDIVHLPMRPGEVAGARVTADTSTMALLGLDPADLMPLEEGVARTVDWFCKMKGITWHDPKEAGA